MLRRTQLVVGTQARILYQDCMGRVNIALKFTNSFAKARSTVMIDRPTRRIWHADVPFRETSNIKDGSNVTRHGGSMLRW